MPVFFSCSHLSAILISSDIQRCKPRIPSKGIITWAIVSDIIGVRNLL